MASKVDWHEYNGWRYAIYQEYLVVDNVPSGKMDNYEAIMLPLDVLKHIQEELSVEA